ncbi:adenosine deaminase [Microbacterium wangchenii]|uniref:adenosine deaminase n=1 Tax=Microbacterium wangchenii TaxID=2541726 RepID=A0ABX5SZH1_9MICO|nr:adenosine deaminase [Microbacterium wangchenii]TXK14854.1 adenosine deaminase [Microbacterium wangchenii]
MRIDLHRHLEGSLRASHLLQVLARSGRSPQRPAEFRAAITTDATIDSLVAYLGRIDTAAAVLTTAEDWMQAGLNAVEDACDDGLDYLELRYCPWFVTSHTGLSPRVVVDAVSEGVARASRSVGLPVGLIAIILRDLGPDAARRQLDTVLDTRDVWCGVDLAGDEAGVPCREFAPVFRRARDAGLHITVHAGEAAGPASVADAVEHLGAERIGHGVRSVEDPRLLEQLAERGTTMEVALTSNTHTGASAGFTTHQIHALLAGGVAVTLNTDNPTTSGTRLSEEHRRAVNDAGLDPATLERIARQAAVAAFTSSGRQFAVRPEGDDGE